MGCLLRATQKSRAGLAYAYADAGDAKVTRSARRIANGCCAARDETGSCRRTQCKPAGSSQRPSGSQPQFQPVRPSTALARCSLASSNRIRRLIWARAPVGAQLTPDRGSLPAEPRTANRSSETVGPALGLRSHPGAQDRPHGFEGAADMRADAIARASARRAGEEFAEPSCQASACKSGVPPTT